MAASEKLAAFIFIVSVFSVYAAETVLISVWVFNKVRARRPLRIFRRRYLFSIHLPAVIGVICFFYGYFIEPYWIEVKTIEIQTEKLTETGIRLVHISDMHCDRKPRNEKKLVELINAAEPDVIVFTGDTINTPAALPRFKDTMKKLKANLGKFAVVGNFEVSYWHRLDIFSDTGFEVLEKNSISLVKNGQTFYISGLSCKYPSAYEELLKSVPENHFSIFLYHYSDLVEDLENLNVDLYLAGHTHGGQVAIPFYGALVTLSKFGKKYESGIYTVGDTILYVNRGIGMEGGIVPRVRFWARPEITVFEIKPVKN